MSAAVLAGGQSRRMGRDKALLDWGDGPMIEHVLRLVGSASGLIDDVHVIGDRPEYHRFGVPVHRDRFDNAGTLGGIATAIGVAQHEHVIVVACDMPLLSREMIRTMVEQPRDYDVLVPALDPDRSGQGGSQTYETLHAIYGKRCLPAIEKRINSGRLKVIGFFDDVKVRTLSEGWVRRFDPELHSFMNVNDPDQLDAAQQIARMRGREGM